jgi:hypothetical protein
MPARSKNEKTRHIVWRSSVTVASPVYITVDENSWHAAPQASVFVLLY